MDEEKQPKTEDSAPPPSKGNHLFVFMAKYPWPFLVIVPAVFALLLGFGWSTDDRIEQEVANLWIAQDGDYAKDQKYRRELGVDDMGSSAFAAMAVARDGGNMLTSENLEAFRQRMEETEGTTVVYKNNTYTWDDFCAITQAPYLSPCLRLSPMDLYKEAQWTFTTFDKVAWYRGIVQDILIAPRLARFGQLTTNCKEHCKEVLGYRSMTNNMLALFADVGNLEYNDNCRMCLEANYTRTIQTLHGSIKPAFGGLMMKLMAFNATLENTEENQALKVEIQLISTNLGKLMETITTDDVVDFYGYYVARGLYAELGAKSYTARYESFRPFIDLCYQVGATCPARPEDMNELLAKRDLLRHADNIFSSVTTAGAPFPFWSEGDGTGALFIGNPETGGLFPVSGSGIDMSGDIMSLQVFLLTNGTVGDPTSGVWQTLVEVNPLYAWFMASLTPAEAGTVCANGNLTGTPLNPASGDLLAAQTPRWCTPFDVPNESNPGPLPVYPKQHFARMWYDLLMSSESFLGVTQGQDDPYSWTNGAGCDYDLGGERYSFTGQDEQDILSNSSRIVYNIDEGTSLGVMDPHLLLGGVTPTHDQYSFENPLQEVLVLQNLYGSLLPDAIVNRLKNCNRPGGPIEMTKDEASELLEIWKEAMENSWNRGWDNENDGPVQFVSFFDDGGGVIGSTGRMLTEITLDNTTLTAVSIVVIALFSCLFMFSFDLVDSRVMLALIGVGLVVLSFFSALGFGLLTGVKINVTIAWTLPFVIIGLGVDDVYIIMNALKKQPGYSLHHWLEAMREIVTPVTMTSLVNASMFAILNISDIPAIYLTSRVALYCVIFLYISVIFCYPAYCLLDCRRQQNNRLDVLLCVKSSKEQLEDRAEKEDIRNTILFDYCYKKIVLNGASGLRYLFHAIIILVSLALFAVGCYGVTERSVGLGLADFFPDNNPAGKWAQIGTDVMAAWVVSLNWGALEYTDPDAQMRMIKQFEDVVANKRIAAIDTKQLWMADFLMWTSRHCDENFDRPEFDQLLCGHDQAFPEEEDSFCGGSWTENTFDLRLKNFSPIVVEDEECVASEGGICRPGEQMHPLDLEELNMSQEEAAGREFCPVTKGWSDAKFEFCVNAWKRITGGGGRLLTKPGTGTPDTCDSADAEIEWPILYSYGPTMYTYDVFTHAETLEMMAETRAVCDDDEKSHCWLSGIPFDYWTQYMDIFDVLLELCGYATLAGFVVSFLFLFIGILTEGTHSVSQVLVGCLIGSLAIAATIIMTLSTVVGISSLSDVDLTGFSNMSFVLSVGFTVEYTVHIISRWLRASTAHSTSLERVEFTMSFLMLPTFMSFVSSTIGTICLAFTEFEFNHTYFFRPLMIVMFVSYWFGCWFLPTVLVYIDFDFVKLGPENSDEFEPAAKVVEDEEPNPAVDKDFEVPSGDDDDNTPTDLHDADA